MVGKAVYEGILLDVQFASFLLAKLLKRNVFLEGVKELDEDIWRNLTFVKRYDGTMKNLVRIGAMILTFEYRMRGRSRPYLRN